ncbi:MAG: hypothetical protein IPH53_11025 [Flavobacteriales bacterium]|nr:hypothetical protein [Flavobacteriales bacterium]
MLQHYTLLLASSLAFGPLAAQTTDLVFFSDDGLKFTLLVDGDQKNAKPASRVVASGIRNEQPMLIINFEDPGVAPIKKAGYFPLGMEYTMMITTNKKGEKVIRATGQAALGNSGALVIDERPRPTEFRDDNPAVLENPSGTTGSTVIVTEQTIQPLDGGACTYERRHERCRGEYERERDGNHFRDEHDHYDHNHNHIRCGRKPQHNRHPPARA